MGLGWGFCEDSGTRHDCLGGVYDMPEGRGCAYVLSSIFSQSKITRFPNTIPELQGPDSAAKAHN